MGRFGALKVLILAVIVSTFEGGSGMFKTHVFAKSNNTTIRLPQPAIDSEISVERALRERRSVRDFADTPLTLAQVAQLLWAAQGITSTHDQRAAPSAGALYPLEVYVVAGTVEGVDPGVYKYLPHDLALQPVAPEDRRRDLCSASLHQEPIRDAPVDLVITGVYERTTRKYHERGVRYVHMEAGHASQNVYLQAESLGLGTVAMGAFDDAVVAQVLNLPKDESPLYVMPIGYPR